MAKTFHKQYSRYYIVLPAIFTVLIITSFVLAYSPCSSVTDIKLGDNVIRISSRHGRMEHPDIAMNNAGDAVVVWQDIGSRDYEIFAQYFNNAGQPVRMPFTVNQYKIGNQKFPKAAVDGKGNFVITWQSYKQDGSGSGIYGQRFLSNGKKTGSEFKINTYIMGNQSNPAIAMNSQGNFVVVWEGEKSVNNVQYNNIYGQRFNANGEKRGKEFLVNKTLNRIQSAPDVCIDNNNNFVVVWQSAMKDNLDIYSRKFNWDEKIAAGDDVLINKTTKFDQKNPVITAVGSNKFMVVWQNISEHQLLDGTMLENLNGQMMLSDGKKSGGEIRITAPFFGHQENPDIIQFSPTKLFVVWDGYDKTAEVNQWRIYGQILTINGALSGDYFPVNPDSNEWNQKVAIASNGKGNVAITWTSSKENIQLVNFIRGGQI